MAEPISTTVLVAKAAATALTDEKLRKGIAWTIGFILSPVILIIVLICGLLSGTADHNNTAVSLCFDGGVISGNIPENYRGYIEDMRGSFTLLDGTIASVNSEMEAGDSLDSTRVKAIFYAALKVRQGWNTGDLQTALSHTRNAPKLLPPPMPRAIKPRRKKPISWLLPSMTSQWSMETLKK